MTPDLCTAESLMFCVQIKRVADWYLGSIAYAVLAALANFSL